jgi:hypothetical protein
MRQILLFFSLFLAVDATLAQGIYGELSDQHGAPVTFARIYTQDQKFGTISDKEGKYQLSLPKGEHTITIRHLSIGDTTFTVQLSQRRRLDIQLHTIDLQLGVVEIEGGKKDPAYGIMKKAIANKSAHLQNYDTYTCETYLKLTLETDTFPSRKERKKIIDSLGVDSLPAIGENKTLQNFIESRSTTYFKAPATYKSIVHAHRDYKNIKKGKVQVSFGDEGSETNYSTSVYNPYLFYQDVSDADINFYRNLIQAPDLGDRPFISPLHNTLWRITYVYKLEETWYEGSRVNYRISFTPRNQDGPYFSGFLILEDNTWAIKEIEVEVLPSTMPYFQKMYIQHEYQQSEYGKWLLAKEEYTYEIKDNRNMYFGSSVAVHSDYQVNVDFPRNFFKNELRRTEKDAFEKDSAAWASLRPVDLKAGEISFTKQQDSIFAYHRSVEYLKEQDSIYNHLKFLDFIVNGITWRNRAKGMTYYIDPFLEQIQPFGVGGYRHQFGGSIRKTWTRYTQLHVYSNINYGFANKDVRGHSRISFVYWPKKFGRAFVKFGNEYDMVNELETITAVLSRGNFIQKRSIAVGNRIELVNGLRLDAEVDFADRSAIDELELTQWSEELFGALNTPVSFDPYREFLIDLKLTYTPGQKYKSEPYRKIIIGSKWPTFYAHYKKAIPGVFNSELNFDFLELGLNQEIQLATFGLSRWTFAMGRFLQAENIRFTDFKFFRGADPYLFANPLRNFQLLGPTISTRNEYVKAHFLHDFNGILMDKIPLLKRTPLQTTAGAGSLYIRDGNFFHSEIYAGLQFPLRIKQQRFKIGGYFVTSYSNHANAINAQVKFGVSFFNPVKNKWSY